MRTIALPRSAGCRSVWRRYPSRQQTLADRIRVLGADHPDTLAIRGNLATGYRAVGRNLDAIRLNEQTLADRMRVLGADHPDTLRSRSNIGVAPIEQLAGMTTRSG